MTTEQDSILGMFPDSVIINLNTFPLGNFNLGDVWYQGSLEIEMGQFLDEVLRVSSCYKLAKITFQVKVSEPAACITTSTEDTFINNPAYDIMRLKLPILFQSNVQYQIFSPQGRLLKSGILQKPQINISDLPPGSYYLSIQRSGNANTRQTIQLQKM